MDITEFETEVLSSPPLLRRKCILLCNFIQLAREIGKSEIMYSSVLEPNFSLHKNYIWRQFHIYLNSTLTEVRGQRVYARYLLDSWLEGSQFLFRREKKAEFRCREMTPPNVSVALLTGVTAPGTSLLTDLRHVETDWDGFSHCDCQRQDKAALTRSRTKGPSVFLLINII